MQIRKKPFLGKGLDYPLALGPDGDFKKVADSPESVRAAITFLLHTLLGERPFRPLTGSRLSALKHEPNSEELRSALQQELYSSILRDEPRVENLEVEVISNPRDERSILVRLTYVVIPENTPQNLVFPFYLAS